MHHHPPSNDHSPRPPPAAPPYPPPGLAGLACVPNPSFCNPCTNPTTDPRPSNVDLFKCRVCSRLLHMPGCANPAVTLPCGNSLHRNCIPPAPSAHKPPEIATDYFDCPFACCKLKAHLRAPEGVQPNCDAVLQHVVAKWADVNRTIGTGGGGALHHSLSSLSLSGDGDGDGHPSNTQCQSQSQSQSQNQGQSHSQSLSRCSCDPSNPSLLCSFCSALKAKFGLSSSASLSSSSSSTGSLKSKSTAAVCTCQPQPTAKSSSSSSLCSKGGSLRKLFKQTFCPKAKAAAAVAPDQPDDASEKPPLSPATSSTSSLPAASDDTITHKPDCPLFPLPPLPPPVQSLPYADFEDLLECQLCYQLLHDPVTLYPCGHTACRACILRTLDHAPRCFLCRTPLESSSYLTYHAHAPNRTLQKFVWHNFPRESWVRAQVLALEARELLSQVPIFICSLTLPGAPVHLHVFEPRYRLMMRRVTAPGAPRLFGMCMPDPRGLPGPAQYGSMLKVESLQWLPDGRCLVQAQAVYAIKVTEAGCTDGYCTARVVQVPDADFVSLDDALPAEIKACIPRTCPAGGEGDVKVRDLVCHASRKLGVFLERLPSVQARHQFLGQFGCMPCDPALFSYWLAGVLPVPVQEKYKLLAMASARDRLVTVMRWFKCVRDRCAPPPPYSAGAGAGAAAATPPPSTSASPAAAAAAEARPSTSAAPGAGTSRHRRASLRRHHSSRSSMASDASMGEAGDDDVDDDMDEDDMDEDEYDEDEDFEDDDNDMDVDAADSPRTSSSSADGSSPGGRPATLVPPLPGHPATTVAAGAASNQAPARPPPPPPPPPQGDRDDACTIM